MAKPVMFPLGRSSRATLPLATGSLTFAKTIGIVRVSRLPWLQALLYAITQMGLLRHRAQDDQEADGATAAGDQDGVAQTNARLEGNGRRVELARIMSGRRPTNSCAIARRAD
jgi:hypothetical protein